jgi:hypothetical protein
VTCIPGSGGRTSIGSSSTHRADVHVRTRHGGTMLTPFTRPESPRVTTRIGALSHSVWIDAVHRRALDVPRRRMPRRRSTNPTARSTPKMLEHPQWRFTRRYGIVAGTLCALWQRQKDVNSALAAPRRTTVASPTLGAAEPANSLLSYFLAPHDRSTTSWQECREVRSARSTDFQPHSSQEPLRSES